LPRRARDRRRVRWDARQGVLRDPRGREPAPARDAPGRRRLEARGGSLRARAPGAPERDRLHALPLGVRHPRLGPSGLRRRGRARLADRALHADVPVRRGADAARDPLRTGRDGRFHQRAHPGVGRVMARVAAVRRGRPTALWVSAGFGGLLIWSWHGTRVDLGSLFGGEGFRQIATYVGRLFPPDASAATVRDAGVGALETFAISLIGSLLAVVIGLPLSLVATRTLLYHGILYESGPLGPVSRALRIAVYALGKALLNVLRTIPEIVWA